MFLLTSPTPTAGTSTTGNNISCMFAFIVYSSSSIVITGGTPPYTIIGDTTGFYPTSYSGETYFITVIDALLCETDVNFEMTGPDAISVTLTSIFDAACPNTGDENIKYLIIGIGINIISSPIIENYPTTYLNKYSKKKLIK